MPIEIGFFRDFKSSNTLLIEGDSSGLRQLADVCRDLAEDGGSTAIHELPFVEVHHGIRVVASTADRDVVGASMNGLDLSWKRSRTGWQETAEKLRALENDNSGTPVSGRRRGRVNCSSLVRRVRRRLVGARTRSAELAISIYHQSVRR